MLTGRCLCGTCSYEVGGDPVVVAHCYCVDCQRLSGAGHTTGAMFPEANLTTYGDLTSFSLTSSLGNTVTRLFCGRCGSSLFGKNTGMPGFITIAVGTVDSPDNLTPQVAIFARSRRPWDFPDPTIEAFDEQPSWKPSDPV